MPFLASWTNLLFAWFLVFFVGYYFLNLFISFAYNWEQISSLANYWEPGAIKYELVGVLLILVLAIVCGVLLLKRVNWARWLAILWLAYHGVLSLFHSPAEMITHFVILALISFLLFLPKSAAYFKQAYQQTDHK